MLGMDRAGRALFIFTRSPYSVQEFAAILLGLPLDLYNVMYLEGGPPASLYLAAAHARLDLFGSYETGVNENDDNVTAWRIPAVIGVAPKAKP